MRWEWGGASPVLTCDFCGDDVVAGTVDGHVWLGKGESEISETKIGKHDAGVRRAEWSPEHNFLVTGSWDRTVRTWDLRSGAVAVTGLPGKCFALCLSGEKIIAGASDQSLSIFDMRSLGQPLTSKMSSLKHQTRALAAFPDGRGCVVSSIEGRVAIEIFADESKNFAFKCHRDDTFIYPVNALAFHPSGTFVSGGSDTKVFSWDPTSKRRLCQISGGSLGGNFPASIADLAFNTDGSRLAIASTYTYDHGEVSGHPSSSSTNDSAIFIHVPLHHEVMPKILAPGLLPQQPPPPPSVLPPPRVLRGAVTS